MVYIPILGALSLSVMAVLEKIGLKKENIKTNHYVVAIFFFAVLFMVPLMFFYGNVSNEIFELKYVLVFLAMITVGVLANVCYFYAMKWEKLSNLEPVHLLGPLFTIALISILFVSERNPQILIPSLIAAGALIFSHVKKHHLDFDRFMMVGVLGSLFFAIESIFIKIILPFFTPVSLYFYRSLFVLISMSIIFRPNLLKEMKGKKNIIIVASIGLLWVSYRVLAIYGYNLFGVIYTTLILMLSPVFIYLFAWRLLKDKPGWRNIVAAVIILMSIAYATFAI